MSTEKSEVCRDQGKWKQRPSARAPARPFDKKVHLKQNGYLSQKQVNMKHVNHLIAPHCFKISLQWEELALTCLCRHSDMDHEHFKLINQVFVFVADRIISNARIHKHMLRVRRRAYTGNNKTRDTTGRNMRLLTFRWEHLSKHTRIRKYTNRVGP